MSNSGNNRAPYRTKRYRAPLFYSKANIGPIFVPFLIILLLLIIFGLVILFSASYSTGYYRHKGDSYYFIRPQIIYTILGLAAAYVISRTDYRFLRRWVWGGYLFTMILLVVVLFMEPINNCRRWINLPGVPTMQVSEIAKFAIILAEAHLLELHRDRLLSPQYGVLLPIAIVVPYWALLFFEPHYSAIILIALMVITIMICSGVGFRFFGLLGGIGAVGALLLLTFQPDYVSTRLEGWTPFSHDTSTMVYQTQQSIYAIGSGGLSGVGIGNSRQKHLWLPESTNDFVFSVLCEELGFIGACLCIGLFVALIILGIVIALRAPDMFGSLLGIGIMSQIAWQTLLNIAVVTNTIPNTGISLPFFSSGGTSLFMLLCEMGIILSISRAGNRARKPEQAEQPQRAAGQLPQGQTNTMMPL